LERRVGILRGNRRFWVIAALGFGSAITVFAQGSLTYGEVGVAVLLGTCGLLALAALLGIGPLHRDAGPDVPSGSQPPRPSSHDSEIDRLIHLGQLRESGEIDQDEFEAAKRRIIGP
jgi:hypothetical protein